MGFAKIVSGGPDGRYTIELDYGKTQRDAMVAGLTGQVNALQAGLDATAIEIADAQAREVALANALDALWVAYEAAAPNARGQIIFTITKVIERLGKEKAANAPLRLKLNALRFDMNATQRELARWVAFAPVTTRGAWCVTFTENKPAGAYVGTAEIPGEPSVTVLVENARSWIPTDGYVYARDVQSPWQAYFNAAVLPGWQKEQPTYRWGTIASINYAGDTADIALASATSSAQSLGINQSSSLAAVPVTYMTCNAGAFKIGDRVVVRFSNRDWSQPRVIGFLDNPRPCMTFPPSVVFPVLFFKTTGVSGGSYPWIDHPFFFEEGWGTWVSTVYPGVVQAPELVVAKHGPGHIPNASSYPLAQLETDFVRGAQVYSFTSEAVGGGFYPVNPNLGTAVNFLRAELGSGLLSIWHRLLWGGVATVKRGPSTNPQGYVTGFYTPSIDGARFADVLASQVPLTDFMRPPSYVNVKMRDWTRTYSLSSTGGVSSTLGYTQEELQYVHGFELRYTLDPL